jgi:hypothetical protein
MSDSLGILTTRGRAGLTPAGRTPAPGTAAQSDEDTCGAFGYLRGIRERALSIEFRFADGNSEAFPYSWLGPVKYNPSAGMLIKFVGDLVYLVLIEGSNLNALVNETVNLYDRGIQRHRISWVREMTRPEQERTGEGEPSVERIRIVSHRPDDEPKGAEWLAAFQPER